MRIDYQKLGRMVSEKRAKQGMSLRDLATELKMSAATLHRIEWSHPPSVDHFLTIVEWLGVEAETFGTTWVVYEPKDAA